MLIPTEWFDISSAPKDGTPVLVDFGRYGIHRVFWDAEDDDSWGVWCVTDNKNEPRPLRGYRDEDVRGWMPLPEGKK